MNNLDRLGITLMLFGLLWVLVNPNESFPVGGSIFGIGAGILLINAWIKFNE